MSFDEFPEIAQSHVQSSESQRALEAILCLPDFIARPLPIDYGKDYDVELCSGMGALNIQFAIQLKSVAQLEVVQAESMIALPFPTSRLNYLSQTPCGSLIVIYDASSKTLFYEWVEAITQTLDAKGMEWREQESVRIHLPIANILLPASAKKIHSDVSSRHRKILMARSNDTMAGPALRLNKSDATLPQQTTTAEMLPLLLSSGLDLVSSGLYRQVIDCYSTIPSIKWSANARHLLTIAFAYEQVGLPLQSLSHAKAALSCTAKPLSQEDALFAKRLTLTARTSLGHIGARAYYSGLSDLYANNSSSAAAKEIRLELIFQELIEPRYRADQMEHVDRVVKEARTLVEATLDAASDWGNQIRLAKIEFQAGNQHAMQGRMMADMAKKLGSAMPIERTAPMEKGTSDLKHSALSRLETVMNESENSKRFDVYAICCLELAIQQFTFVMLAHMMDKTDGNSTQAPPNQNKEVEICLLRADTAAKLFEELKNEVMTLKALHIKAEILHFSNRKTEAAECLALLQQKADLLGIIPDVFRLAGAEALTSDGKDELADANDDQLMHFAKSVISSLTIPESRLPNVFKEFQTVRLVHQEQRAWCRHIEILQAREHAASPETHYAIDPLRACACARHGYQTRVGHPDAALVIESFKSTYCAGCTTRET